MPEADLCGLSWFDAGARSFYSCAAPIRRLEDMRGRIVRVQDSSLMCDMVTALGATPVTSSFSQVYSGLQSGEMDTAENNFPSYDSMKHYQVAPYFSEDQHMRIPEMQIVSRRIWDTFSDEEQEILRTAARESAAYERTLWAERETESRRHVLEQGTIVNELDAGEHERFCTAVEPLFEQYCADWSDLVDAIRAT
jgi:TRAP-type C4-dicarboxylate transport system substrate-binding protein